jgi:hypothetical protein
MIAKELYNRLYELIYTCRINQLYHQKKALKCWRWDKFVKIAVASLAVLALIATFWSEDWKTAEHCVAGAALVAAIILNVLPVGEWEGHFSELFRSWSDLRTSAERLMIDLYDYADEERVENWLVDSYSDLQSRKLGLNADEWEPDDKLLSECQRLVNRSFHGHDTYEEIMQARGAVHDQVAGAEAVAAGAEAQVE